MAWSDRDIPDPTGRATDAWLATLGTDSAHDSQDDVLAALDAARGRVADARGPVERPRGNR